MTAPEPQTEPVPDPPGCRRWRCPNCGQMTFTLDDAAPDDICAYCDDFTTWEPVPEG